MKFNEYQKFANKICIYFQSLGFETYWVGGAVRDIFSGVDVSDIDIATEATPEQTKKILRKMKVKFFDVGEKFGTIGAQQKNFKVEITTFRTESAYRDFRHPQKVSFVKDIAQDAKRRDFTINALYFNPKNEELIDFVGGKKDLKARVLRFVGSAEKRIKEDPLRLLRAVRFASTLNFKIATKDAAAIKKYAGLILKISGERLKPELDKILLSKNNIFGVELLSKTRLLEYLLPELDRLQKVKQSKDFHAEGNAFIHSLLTLKNVKEQDLVMRYAALLHDIGKFYTAKRTTRNGRPHISFIGHGPKGAQLFSKIAKRLRFSARDRSAVEYLIKHHMDLMHIDQISARTIQKYAKNKDFRRIIKLRIADSAASHLTTKEGKPEREDLKPWQKLFKLADKAEQAQQTKLISGNNIMRILKLNPSKKVGQLLERIKDLQIAGKINTKKQAINYIKSLDKN